MRKPTVRRFRAAVLVIDREVDRVGIEGLWLHGLVPPRSGLGPIDPGARLDRSIIRQHLAPALRVTAGTAWVGAARAAQELGGVR